MHRTLTLDLRVEEIAKAHGVSMAQIAIAWSLSRDEVTAPIIGSTKIKNLEDAVGETLRDAFLSCPY